LPTQGIDMHKRDIPLIPPPPSSQNSTSSTASQTDTASTAPSSTPTSSVSPTNTTTSITPTNATTAPTTLPTLSTTTTTLLNITSTTTTTTTTASATNATSSPTDTNGSGDNKSLVIGGAAVGGLVFTIGFAIIAFRCTLNRRDRQRRNKEMAATLAENFDRDPVSSPRKGYMELGDGPQTPNSGRGGSNLSRQGSQDAYFAAHKEGDYYNPHYVQERYGTANAGNYGMYEETELSVIGGSTGRTATPYIPHGDHSMAYPPPSMTTNHYAGYNDYNGQNDRGYYGGGGQGY
ncbi:hypothetical protein BGX26_001834, partial [Mortierella sp. AD094]